MRILYYSPASYGGLADYAHEQATALEGLGVKITFLCTPVYLETRNPSYECVPILREVSPRPIDFNQVGLNIPVLNKTLKACYFIRNTLYNFSKLTRYIVKNNFKHVLFGSYIEYLAPLWAGSLKRLTCKGVIFGAVVHDPVRDYVLGPLWWHRWSIASGYSFLSEAFVHADIELDTVQPMPHLHMTIIPHGEYHFPPPILSKDEMRLHLNLPQNAKVMLAFGHLRTNKNLDFVIRAMAFVPEIYLVVAGSETSSSQNLAPIYQALSREIGVDERIRWQIEFIPDEEIGNFFIAADVILLTYSQTFRSASGVLNTAIQYRRPCIISGGEGCLAYITSHYNLGISVEPDDLEALIEGLHKWLSGFISTEWEIYLRNNSWQTNATLTLEALTKK